MLELRLRLFGTPEIRIGGRPVALRRRSALALLAYLAVTGRPHRREALATLLSDDGAGEQAGRLLSNAVFELRGVIGEHLVVTPQEVALSETLPRWLDVAAFRAALTAALAAGDARGLREALGLHRDELLAGVLLRDAPQFEAWLLGQREELLVLLVRGLQALVDYHVRCGPEDEGIGAARRLLALEPWREEVHRKLMVLLARGGQRSAALKQFEVCRRVLAEELQTEPDVATVALAARLRAGPQPVAHNLPPEAVPLVGRAAELERLEARLADPACRVLSLVGLGGSGKTELALRAARRCAGAVSEVDPPPFPDGVFLVPLADVSAGETAAAAARGITGAIAGVLGVAAGGGADPLPALARALGDRALLLVLDNLEHLVDGAAVLWELVRQAPRVKLLVTSRARLRLLGEWELEVRGLPVPDGPEAVEWAPASVLFLQQAGRTGGGSGPDCAALDAAEREAVVDICRLTGGLPLPLVLAAAWSPVLSFADIGAELRASLDVPETWLRGLPARQRRLSDILGAVWDRLAAPEQAVLRWLPLFRGGFTREAARAVVGASPQQLLRLMDLFLVSPGPGGRFRLDEVVSRFATRQQAGRAEERAHIGARHAAYFAAYVQQRAPALRRSLQAVAELESERLDILAAWEWAAAQGHADLLERMRPGLLLFHQLSATAASGASAAPDVSPALSFPGPGSNGSNGSPFSGLEPARPTPWAPPPDGAGVARDARALAVAAR